MSDKKSFFDSGWGLAAVIAVILSGEALCELIILGLQGLL